MKAYSIRLRRHMPRSTWDRGEVGIREACGTTRNVSQPRMRGERVFEFSVVSGANRGGKGQDANDLIGGPSACRRLGCCLLVLPSEEGLAKPVARPALRGIAGAAGRRLR